MTTYCRLCAELKTIDDLNTTINDKKLKIEEKLIVCCQWNNYQSINSNFPDAVCNLCCEKLEKCWLFNESVAIAQTKLEEIFRDTELVDIKYETNTEDDEFNPVDTSVDIFVEPLKLAAVTKDDAKPLINTTNNSLDEIKSHHLHECDICHKTFTTAYNLTTHGRTHSGERPYPCSKCRKHFKSSSNLNQHLRQVHSKEKQQNDDDEIHGIKDEKTPPMENVAESSTLNSEGFQYACQDCGRRFRLKCTLTAHRTVHSNERPFECWICHRS